MNLDGKHWYSMDNKVNRKISLIFSNSSFCISNCSFAISSVNTSYCFSSICFLVILLGGSFCVSVSEPLITGVTWMLLESS